MKENAIIIAILVVLIGGAIWYIVKAKKSGAKCIGCSAGGSCSSKGKSSEGCGCGCGGENTTKTENRDEVATSRCCCGTDTKA